ncbi:serine/threonine-protein kinase [Bifidobacterium xylocopae]|uniref:serine/threonine-protein kinase n=1 Tax=Bifidobacterium xylocopae TaxID=2493119 RepID=UPI001374C25E|nr:serine/threonine-protein kinase [Bifidobacterium xylocopae]
MPQAKQQNADQASLNPTPAAASVPGPAGPDDNLDPGDGAGPSAPEIRGFQYLRPLGEGGTCWVHLYRQLEPRRLVAVKVSKRRSSGQSHKLFLKEATFMARLSEHPAILSILSAGVSRDGRDYIVMEYAPGGNYKRIMKTSRLDERGALDLGVRMASALYTAHQAGIIHRDVKPANFLLTRGGLPALSDFGISASTYMASSARGLSIPWAAPEVIAHKSGGSEASDIYSLGASLFGLLVGRSPYEYGFRVRNEHELMEVIGREGPPRLRQGVVSEDFERVLDKAMAHDPDDRYFSALDFGRDMQVLQNRLHGHMTPLIAQGADPYPSRVELGEAGRLWDERAQEDGNRAADTSEDTGGTGLSHAAGSGGPGTNGADGAAAPPGSKQARRAQSRQSGENGGRTRSAEGAGGRLAALDRRPAPAQGGYAWEPVRPSHARTLSDASVAGPGGRRLAGWSLPRLVLTGLLVTALGIGGGAGLARQAGGGGFQPATSTASRTTASAGNDGPAAQPAPTVPTVTGGQAVWQGTTAVFSWSNPDPRDGDRYIWKPAAAQAPTTSPADWQGAQESDQPQARIPGGQEGTVCIQVALVRADQRVSDHPTRLCASRP